MTKEQREHIERIIRWAEIVGPQDWVKRLMNYAEIAATEESLFASICAREHAMEIIGGKR